jgi:dipeptidyl aminopeptidase/acylaminoacyl peptidase
MKRLTFLVAGIVILSAESAAQQLITVCKTPKGWSYYHTQRENKWAEDGISRGGVTLIRDSNGKYDLLIEDNVNTTSITESGSEVAVTYESADHPRTIILVTRSPLGLTESFMFLLDEFAKGEVLWTMLKPDSSRAGISKGSFFRASCKK